MSAERDVGHEEEGIERQATAMQDQVSKEVASWSKDRRRQLSGTVITPVQPITQRRSPRPTGEAIKSGAPPSAGKPPGGRSKPFSMSYGGMTQAEYIQYLRDQGSR